MKGRVRVAAGLVVGAGYVVQPMVPFASGLFPAVPLASASGYAVVGGAVLFALVLLRVLLRMEARDAGRKDAEEEAARSADPKRLSPP